MDSASSQREKVYEELLALFSNAKLPTSPAIAKQILDVIDDPYSTAQQFSRFIEADPALAAKLLRMANSARYAQRNPVTTIQRAVTVIGLGQLRVVALGFELVGHLDRLGSYPFDLRAFWRHAARQACLAREIALEVVPPLAEEAFLVGLLQDAGILPLVQTLGGDYAELCRKLSGSPTEFYRAERRHFPYTHVDAIGALCSLWELPESIVTPLVEHHARVRLGGRASDATRLRAVGWFVGGCDVDGTTGRLVPSLDACMYARDELRLNQDRLDARFKAAEIEYRQIAHFIEFERSEELDVAHLLVTANRHLQRRAVETEERMREVESHRDQVLDEQVTLRSALGQYREQAARDPLTGLMNRRALLDACGTCLERITGGTSSITIMFLDLDDFKQINDLHGHATGDAVLCGVADILARFVGDHGVAGRFGGEEFIVILPGLTEAAAREAGAALVRVLRSVKPADGPLPRPVTTSAGIAYSGGPEHPGTEELIATADELMYVAKRAGKNQAHFKAVGAIRDSRRAAG